MLNPDFVDAPAWPDTEAVTSDVAAMESYWSAVEQARRAMIARGDVFPVTRYVGRWRGWLGKAS